MPNIIAYTSIIIWPIIVLALVSRKNLPLGIFIAFLCSYLFLPAGFEINLKGIPAFTKQSTTVITIALFILFKGLSFGFKELDVKIKACLIIFTIIPILTAATNQSPHLHLPPMTFYDGITQTYVNLMMSLSFLIGAKFFKDRNTDSIIVKTIVIFGLIYSIAIAYEIRMSPQLHSHLYGFFPHHFNQQIRSDGFRAVVFLGHGLLVAIFLSTVLICCFSLAKRKIKIFGFNAYFFSIYLLVLMFLSKSLGALALTLIALYLLYFTKNRTTAYISIMVSTIILGYPFIATLNIIPYDTILSLVNLINDDRARSLEFRFYNESILLSHAFEKPFFGWGSWGRNRVYNPETLEDLSTTDGHWIILIGTYGFLGFVSLYYIFFRTFLTSLKAFQKSDKETTIKTLLIIMLVILIDQIPNSSFNYFYFLMLGVLYGVSSQRLRNIKQLN